jgi:trk system potassium uptake protein TrkH
MSAIVGATGIGVSAAEGRGDQLVPQVRKSARLVLIIYSGYAIAGILAYRLVGLSFFDSINHSFTAVSTGGFSTYAESIGRWNSLAVESVTIPLMILGNLSFVTAWLLWRGKMRFVMLNGEVRLQAFLIPVSAAAVFIFTARNLYPQMGKAARVAVFETVSALTTTGFQTVGYGSWNAFGIFVLIILMLIGGGTCSTAGGIKQFRIYFLWKVMIWEIKQTFFPQSVVIEQPVWEGERRAFVDPARVRQVLVFVFIYLMTYAAGTLILCASGFSLQDSMFEFASAIGTVGLSVGVTSYTMPSVALWAETIAMYLGRLEFIIVFISVIKLVRDMRIISSRKKI